MTRDRFHDLVTSLTHSRSFGWHLCLASFGRWFIRQKAAARAHTDRTDSDGSHSASDCSDQGGYVLNVVSTSAGVMRGRALLLPYGVASDYAAIGSVDVDELSQTMRWTRRFIAHRTRGRVNDNFQVQSNLFWAEVATAPRATLIPLSLFLARFVTPVIL